MHTIDMIGTFKSDVCSFLSHHYLLKLWVVWCLHSLYWTVQTVQTIVLNTGTSDRSQNKYIQSIQEQELQVFYKLKEIKYSMEDLSFSSKKRGHLFMHWQLIKSILKYFPLKKVYNAKQLLPTLVHFSAVIKKVHIGNKNVSFYTFFFKTWFLFFFF